MGSQRTDSEGNHRNGRGRSGHGFFAVQRATLRAVDVVLFFAVLCAASAPAQTLFFSGDRFDPELSEDPSYENGPDAASLPEPRYQSELNSVQLEPWEWQVLPDGLIYPSYLAGPKEPRLAGVWNHDPGLGWMLDLEAGGRVALLRYGTENLQRPDGWELGIEGAAFPRLDADHEGDMISTDFRVGVPLTFGFGPWRMKLAVYHLSSHLGDEFMLRFPDIPRDNYSRNAIVLGSGCYLTEDVFLYGEAEWAFYTDGYTQPWQFQFGVDYTSLRSASSPTGSPFEALNGILREEVDYGGSFVAQAGWQWRGRTNHLFRIGVQYFTGKSDQHQFFCRDEDKVGIGIWYDF